MRCALVILCAVALLLTACGGAGVEEPDDFPSFEDTQSEQPTPDKPGASTVSGDTDAQSVSGEPDAPPVHDETDEPSPPDEQDAQSSRDDTPSVPDEPDDTDAQLLGELLPEVTAVGEGVSVGKLAYDSSPDFLRRLSAGRTSLCPVPRVERRLRRKRFAFAPGCPAGSASVQQLRRRL